MNTPKIRAFGVTQYGTFNNDFRKLTLYALVELPPFIDITPAGHTVNPDGSRRIFGHQDAILNYHPVQSNRGTEKLEQIILPIQMDEDWNGRNDHKTGIGIIDSSNNELDAESMETSIARDKDDPFGIQLHKAMSYTQKYILPRSLIVTKHDRVTPTNAISDPKIILVDFMARIPDNCDLEEINGSNNVFYRNSHAIAEYRLVCSGNTPANATKVVSRNATVYLDSPWMSTANHKSGASIADSDPTEDEESMSTSRARDKDDGGLIIDA